MDLPFVESIPFDEFLGDVGISYCGGGSEKATTVRKGKHSCKSRISTRRITLANEFAIKYFVDLVGRGHESKNVIGIRLCRSRKRVPQATFTRSVYASAFSLRDYDNWKPPQTKKHNRCYIRVFKRYENATSIVGNAYRSCLPRAFKPILTGRSCGRRVSSNVTVVSFHDTRVRYPEIIPVYTKRSCNTMVGKRLVTTVWDTASNHSCRPRAFDSAPPTFAPISKTLVLFDYSPDRFRGYRGPYRCKYAELSTYSSYSSKLVLASPSTRPIVKLRVFNMMCRIYPTTGLTGDGKRWRNGTILLTPAFFTIYGRVWNNPWPREAVDMYNPIVSKFFSSVNKRNTGRINNMIRW